MTAFFFDYGLFALKVLTIVIAVLVLVGAIIALKIRFGDAPDGHLEVIRINEQYEQMHNQIQAAVSNPDLCKMQMKKKHREAKATRKAQRSALKKNAAAEASEELADEGKARLFVLNFDGDIAASAVTCLRREITAVLSVARESDGVVLRLESGGGQVHAYGLAASQLQRIRDRDIPLTVCIDKVAASGGYMMACVAGQLLAAPFAVIGSIGVVAELPNFHRLLKKHHVDYEMITAGEYKRTVTMFGENTEKDRQKLSEDIEEIHTLFKDFVTRHRPQLKIDEVATGEIWFGQRALERALIDRLLTSDEYIADACTKQDVFEVKYVEKKTLPEKLGLAMQHAADGVLLRWWKRSATGQFYS